MRPRPLGLMIVGLALSVLAGCRGNEPSPPTAPTEPAASTTSTARETAEEPPALAGAQAEAPDASSAEDCAAYADKVVAMNLERIRDTGDGHPDPEGLMAKWKAEFLSRCPGDISAEVIRCGLAADSADALVACGPKPPDPSGEAPRVGLASVEDCRAFVAKLGDLAARDAPPELVARMREDLKTRGESIVDQCVAQAPKGVIDCALAADSIEAIDKCHKDGGMLDEEPRPTPEGPLATEAQCRAFTDKFTELNAAALPEEQAATMRETVARNMDRIVADCTREMPQATIECALAADSLEAVMRCDTP